MLTTAPSILELTKAEIFRLVMRNFSTEILISWQFHADNSGSGNPFIPWYYLAKIDPEKLDNFGSVLYHCHALDFCRRQDVPKDQILHKHNPTIALIVFIVWTL